MNLKHPSRGIIVLVIGNLFFAMSWVAIKKVSGSIPLFEIIFFRSAIGAVFASLFLFSQRRPLQGKNTKLLYLRSLLGFLSLILTFSAIAHAGIGNVAVLTNTTPFFVIFFAPMILREEFRKDILLWIVFAFIGILLILKPGVNIVETSSVLAIFVGLFNAFVALCVRKLHETDDSWTITFYFMWTTALASIPFMARGFVMPTNLQLLLLIFMGITIGAGQVLAAYAYKFGPATVISPFTYSFVLFTYVAGMVFLGELPGLLSLIGAGIVAAVGAVLTYKESAKEVLPSPREAQT